MRDFNQCKCGNNKYLYAKSCRKCFLKTYNPTSRLGKFATKGIIPWNIKEKPSYRSLHMWVQLHLGKQTECSNCKITANGHSIHWANKSGKYLRNVNDWIRLCAKCHGIYDKKNKLRKRKKIIKLNNKLTK